MRTSFIQKFHFRYIKTFVAFACVAVTAFTLVNVTPALAQQRSQQNLEIEGAARGIPPKRVLRPMVAIDPITLQAEGLEIRLWGVQPARSLETSLEMRALDMLDKLISNEPVNCRVMSGVLPVVYATCSAYTGEDLGLTLLQNGLAVVDRRQTFKSVFASAYAEAQDAARLAKKGVWRLVTRSEHSGIPDWLEPRLPWLLPLGLIFGPLLGLALIAFMTWRGFRHLALERERENAQARRKEKALAQRERLMLITALETELLDNKNKIDAYIAVNRDLLRDLQSGSAKYQQSGDIVQKHPALSKDAFEANMDNLRLLDIQTAGVVSKLYTRLHANAEYVNLEPTVPLDTAVKLLEKVIEEAQALIPEIDNLISLLQRELDHTNPAPSQ